MKTLPTEFTKNDFEHKQIARRGMFAVFKRNLVGSKHFHFEAIRIRSHNGYTVAGNYVEPAETYASSSKWGEDGFTLPTLERAMEKLAEMEAAK